MSRIHQEVAIGASSREHDALMSRLLARNEQKAKRYAMAWGKQAGGINRSLRTALGFGFTAVLGRMALGAMRKFGEESATTAMRVKSIEGALEGVQKAYGALFDGIITGDLSKGWADFKRVGQAGVDNLLGTVLSRSAIQKIADLEKMNATMARERQQSETFTAEKRGLQADILEKTSDGLGGTRELEAELMRIADRAEADIRAIQDRVKADGTGEIDAAQALELVYLRRVKREQELQAAREAHAQKALEAQAKADEEYKRALEDEAKAAREAADAEEERAREAQRRRDSQTALLEMLAEAEASKLEAQNRALEADAIRTEMARRSNMRGVLNRAAELGLGLDEAMALVDTMLADFDAGARAAFLNPDRRQRERSLGFGAGGFGSGAVFDRAALGIGVERASSTERSIENYTKLTTKAVEKIAGMVQDIRAKIGPGAAYGP